MPMEERNKAKWLWYELHEFDLVNTWMQARRTFELSTLPKEARINVTADSHYRLFVNGKHVHRGPARGFQRSWPYDTVDIAPYLKRGENVIGALVHCLGVGTFGYLHEGNAGFLLWGKVGTEDISTDKTWKVRPAPGYIRTLTRVSLELNFQEIFEARYDDGGWLSEDYDDSKWKVPFMRNFGCMPWPKFEERGIPSLKEEVILPKRIVSESSGKCKEAYDIPTNLVWMYLKEKKKWAKGRTRMTEANGWIKLQVPPTGEDGYRAYCIEYEKEVVGSLELDVSGAKGNEIVDTLVCEAVNKLTPIFQPITVAGRMSFGNRLYLREGRTVHEQYDHWGHRYLVVIVRNSEVPLDIKLRLHWVGYPLDVKASFRSSDNRLNRIYEMCVWSQQCCMLDSYIDCPWREQAQWWGDARVQGRNTFFLSADTRLFKRGIRQLGTQESYDGLTYGVTPTTSHRCILPDFSLVWILTQWDYYWQTGDLSLFKQYRERLHRLLAYFKGVTGKNGLIPYDDRYWLFLDWHQIFKDGYPTIYNLLYLLALRKASDLFKLVRDHRSSSRYARRARELERAIGKGLWNPDKGVFFGGRDWNDRPVEQETAHSMALAILLDLFPEHQQGWVDRRLVPMVKGKYTAKSVPSPYFMYYIFEALKKKGKDREVIDCIRRWWGSMLDRGLTTTEEVWNAQAGNHSLCHAWSAHPIIHLSNILLGIDQTAPGWKTVKFSPTFSHVRSVDGKVATPQGIICVHWEKKGKKTEVSLSLPNGIKGTVDIPGVEAKKVQGKGRWVV